MIKMQWSRRAAGHAQLWIIFRENLRQDLPLSIRVGFVGHLRFRLGELSLELPTPRLLEDMQTTMKIRMPSGTMQMRKSSSTLSLRTQTPLCLTPLGLRVNNGSKLYLPTNGSISGGNRRVLPTLCSSGIAHPGEVRLYLHNPAPFNQRNASAEKAAECFEESRTRNYPPNRATQFTPPKFHQYSTYTQERSDANDFLTHLTIPSTAMAKGLGSSGKGATMERSKLSLKQEQRASAPKLDDGMGGGGLGKGIFNGGGGDGGDGDDDDYFNEFGDGDGDGDGDGFFRKVFAELYDAKAIAAVLQEWYKTMADLPLILRQAAQMGLFSSAALVRFMSMDVRPNVTRFVTRALPPTMSREVVGRLMADPAFMQKLLLEQMITISASLMYEARVRGDNFWKELDFVAMNTLALSAANAAVVYLVSPTRAAPAPARHAWQNLVSKLPNNVFESTTPLREYSTNSRVASLFVKSAELCGVGMLAGAAQSALSQAAAAIRRKSDPEYTPSVRIPSIKQNALGMAAAYGIFANARYQIIAGFDKYLFDHANYLWSYLTLSGFLRAASTHIGDQTRLYLCGMPRPSVSASSMATMRQAEAARRMQRERLIQRYRQQAYAAGGMGTSAGGVTKKGKKKKSKRSASGFEMGVGPASVAA